MEDNVHNNYDNLTKMKLQLRELLKLYPQVTDSDKPVIIVEGLRSSCLKATFMLTYTWYSAGCSLRKVNVDHALPTIFATSSSNNPKENTLYKFARSISIV